MIIQKCRVNIRAVRRPLTRSPKQCVLPSLSYTSILRVCDSSSVVSSVCASDATDGAAISECRFDVARRTNGLTGRSAVGGVAKVGKCPPHEIARDLISFCTSASISLPVRRRPRPHGTTYQSKSHDYTAASKTRSIKVIAQGGCITQYRV
jgi:hypothetical protein